MVLEIFILMENRTSIMEVRLLKSQTGLINKEFHCLLSDVSAQYFKCHTSETLPIACLQFYMLYIKDFPLITDCG